MKFLFHHDSVCADGRKVRCGSEVGAWLARAVTQWDCHKRLLTPRGLKQVIRTALHPCPPKSSLSLSPSLRTGTAQKVSLNLLEFPPFFARLCS